jgi:hypothetical protein
MEGRIEVESEYGKGSTFTVTVPQKVVSAQPIGDFSKAVRSYLDNIETEEVMLYAPGARLLVVDDNEMNLDVMEGLLRDTRIRTDLVDCDYYDWKEGKPWAVNAYRGEYMAQYDWAELTHGTLAHPEKK